MSPFSRFGRLPLLVLATMFCTVGCRANQDQTAAIAGQNGTQDQASDPASANLAPISTDSSTQAPTQYSDQQSPPPPDAGGSYNQASNQPVEDPGYGEQPEYTADQPPPPLPDYDQPQAPGDGYLWTPGYWAWDQDGYYWVPGAWVEAPYEGALWTPGYWGYWNNSYGYY